MAKDIARRLGSCVFAAKVSRKYALAEVPLRRAPLTLTGYALQRPMVHFRRHGDICAVQLSIRLAETFEATC